MAAANYERFPMMSAAWQLATTAVGAKGELPLDPALGESRFLKRKCCAQLAKDECIAVLRTAIRIAQATQAFRYSRCGPNPPRARKRYELLLALATELEETFSDCDQTLVRWACHWLERHWDR